MGTEKTHEYAPTLGYSNREGEEGVTSECLFGVCPARKKQCHILAGELVKECHSAANSMPLSSGGGVPHSVLLLRRLRSSGMAS